MLFSGPMFADSLVVDLSMGVIWTEVRSAHRALGSHPAGFISVCSYSTANHDDDDSDGETKERGASTSASSLARSATLAKATEEMYSKVVKNRPEINFERTASITSAALDGVLPEDDGEEQAFLDMLKAQVPTQTTTPKATGRHAGNRSPSVASFREPDAMFDSPPLASKAGMEMGAVKGKGAKASPAQVVSTTDL